jgi:hypothetical protein
VRPLFRRRLGSAMQFVNDQIHFYKRFILDSWGNMTPMQYGFLLVAVAAIGWLCMKSAPR